MKNLKTLISVLLVLAMMLSMTSMAFASTFTDAHGNVVELDDTLEAYTENTLLGADSAARKEETNLGDLWADALRWFAVSGQIDQFFEEDDVKAGNNSVAVDADHIVAMWNGGNLRADIAAGEFGAEDLAKVLPYPNKVAVVYMTGAQMLEALEAASQSLPYIAATDAASASFLQVSGLSYTVNAYKAFDKGEAYGKNWFKANSVRRVEITDVNGKPLEEDGCYAVITHNANFNGMDSSYVFKAAAEANEKSAITTAVVRDVVWMFLQNELQNKVGEEYAQPQGRITVVKNVFSDVVEGAYYMDPLYYVTSHGIMEGTNGGKFNPNGEATRAMVVTVLYRMAGAPAVETEETEWFAAGRAWAMQTGVSDGTNMAKTITREQLVTMIYRFAQGEPVESDLSQFADAASVSDWAQEAMAWAVSKGIIEGSNGKLNPKATANRAQLATILTRCCTMQ